MTSQVKFVDKLPEKPPSKEEQFWSEVRKELIANPGKLALVRTYNHPTVAYRERRDILQGLNNAFPEGSKQWGVNVIRDEKSAFYGPRSGRLTYKHGLYMIYIDLPLNKIKE